MPIVLPVRGVLRLWREAAHRPRLCKGSRCWQSRNKLASLRRRKHGRPSKSEPGSTSFVRHSDGPAFRQAARALHFAYRACRQCVFATCVFYTKTGVVRRQGFVSQHCVMGSCSALPSLPAVGGYVCCVAQQFLKDKWECSAFASGPHAAHAAKRRLHSAQLVPNSVVIAMTMVNSEHNAQIPTSILPRFGRTLGDSARLWPKCGEAGRA